MAKIEIDGLEELQKRLKENVTMDLVKDVVRRHGTEMREVMVQNADFTKGYATGETKRSITLDIEDGGFTAVVYPQTHYSVYLEYGTRKMEAQPFVRPAANHQKPKFKRQMESLVK